MASLTTGYKKKSHVKKCLISVLLILWAYNYAFAANLELSIKEKQWLDKLPPLRVGVSNSWLPINFKGDGATHQGVASDYMKLVSKKLGLKLESTFGTWQELQIKIKAGEIDLLPSVAFSKEKQAYLHFTEPYLSMPTIIATRIDAPHYPHIENLKEVIVGVGENFAVQARLKRDYPEMNTRGYTTIEDAVLALDSGEIDALVTNATVYTYFQNKYDLKTSIHINNTTQYTDKIAIGVRHELAPLVPLLNRALADISDDERDLILDKWANLTIRQHIDWTLAWQLALPVAIFLLLIFYSNRKMAAEIVKRKEYEKKIVSQQKRLSALWGVSSMLDASIKEICERVLEEIVEMTQSPYGFYGFMNSAEDTMEIFSWSKNTMAECAIHDKPLVFSIEKSGIWGNAVRTREPFMLNDYREECDNKKGFPEGHVALTRVLSVPVIMSEKIVAVAAVANKQTNYNDDDINQLKSFLSSVHAIIDHRRLEQDLGEELDVNTILAELGSQLTAPDLSLTEIAKYVLNAAQIMTGSEHGYVSEIDPKTKNNVSHTLTMMLGESCLVQEGQEKIAFPPNEDGSYGKLWGHSLNTGEAFFSNLADQHFKYEGLPEGHVPITQFLSIPVIYQDETIGQIALANPGQDYSEKDLHHVCRLADLYAMAVIRHRVETERIDFAAKVANSSQLTTLGEMSAGIAHEINNPIQGVINYGQLLFNRSEDGSSQKDIAQKIIHEGDRIANIVKNLLNFSRQREAFEVVNDIKSLVEVPLSLMTKKILAEGIEINLTTDEDLPPVHCNPQQIEQVLINLIDNAQFALHDLEKAGQREKRIDIRVVEKRRDDGDRIVAFSVQDNGSGISEEVRKKIFKPFYTTKATGAGTGLGLSIVKKIMASHQGDIDIESQPGEYTRFTFWLPIIQKE